VIDEEGRTDSLWPDRQMVRARLACVTSGSIAPGVQPGSGSAKGPEPVA
jgi:hypothetical protein